MTILSFLLLPLTFASVSAQVCHELRQEISRAEAKSVLTAEEAESVRESIAEYCRR